MDIRKAKKAQKAARKRVADKASKTRAKEKVVRQRAANSQDFATGGFGAPSAATTGDAQTNDGAPPYAAGPQ
jgi:hypothetical protein